MILNLKKIPFLFILLTCGFTFAQMPKVKYESIDNHKLAYYEAGEFEETIILLHGWPQTSYVWRKVIPELSKNYRVIAIDLPGLGKSYPINNYSTENVSQIIHDFLKQKGITKINLVGHDLGTWVAYTYALKYQDNLQTLTLVDAGIPGLMNKEVFQPENADKIWQFYFHGINDLPEILTKNNEKEYFNWYFTNKSYIKDAITSDDQKEYVKAYQKKGVMKTGFDYYRVYTENALFNQANSQEIKIPVLAIGGEFALGNNVGNAVSPFAENLTNVNLKNSGHYVPEEQPQVFIDHLLKFIKN